MTHTSGPWSIDVVEVDPLNGHSGISIITESGHRVAEVYPGTVSLDAWFNDAWNGYGYWPGTPHEANANLIVSSPDMLQALRAARDELERIDTATNTPVSGGIIQTILDAIAKTQPTTQGVYKRTNRTGTVTGLWLARSPQDDVAKATGEETET